MSSKKFEAYRLSRKQGFIVEKKYSFQLIINIEREKTVIQI